MYNGSEEIKDSQSLRSRFAVFNNGDDICKRRSRRSRELSRIPVKAIKRALKKRKCRKRVVRNILKNVPKTSVLYQVMKSSLFRKALAFCNEKFVIELGDETNKKYFDICCTSLLMESGTVYKNVNHKKIHITTRLSDDVETNPGPNAVDSSKTICAPYSQGDASVFGRNAGTQCVAMSLCAILYNYEHGIKSPSDLVEVMNIGNEMYTYLSRSAQQEYLLLTEIPEVVCIRDAIYHLRYSESFHGNIFDNYTVEENICLPLEFAFESLLREGYQSFILTISILTVAVFHANNGCFKVFDSHSRNSRGMSDALGTCVLLELASVAELVEYFQNLHVGRDDALYEVKGVQILMNAEVKNVEPETSDICTTLACENIKKIRECCVVCLYAICFSVIKGISKWDEDTLAAIIENGKKQCENISVTSWWSISDLPNLVIKGANVKIEYSKVYKKVIQDHLSLLNDEIRLAVTENQDINSGFLMSISNCCYVACIFKRESKRKISYVIFGLDDMNGKGYIFEKFHDIKSAMIRLGGLISHAGRLSETYEMQFINCKCELSKKELQLVIRRHKSSKQKAKYAEKRRQYYAAMEPEKKRACLEHLAERYISMTRNEKERLSIQKSIRYKNTREQTAAKYRRNRVQIAKKYQGNKNKIAEKYQENKEDITQKYKRTKEQDPEKYNSLRQCNALKYNSMSTDEKENYIKKQRQMYQNRCSSARSLDYYIQQFNRATRDGPYYICIVCNRLLYRKTVIEFKKTKYNCNRSFFTSVVSFNGKKYVCLTCDKNIKKNKVPCQAVYNDLVVDDIPAELATLEKLEQILISQRIVFEKIVIMPRGQQRKIKGVVCNVPVSCEETCKVLPRPPDSSGIIMLKLKRKLQFRGHVYFQAVRPRVIETALQWLQSNNPLYQSTMVDLTNIDDQLTSIGQNESDDTVVSDNELMDTNKEETTDDCEREDPLNEHRAATCETCLQPVIPDYPVMADAEESGNSKSAGNEIYDIAPGENKHPVSIMMDRYCEELAFPVLFPLGRFGYKRDRKIKLTPVKYFNARLLHFSGRFAMSPEYLFFAQFIIEQKKVSDSITIALKKLHGQPVTASQVRSNEQSIKNLIFKEQAYLFLRSIPGSPPYWQKFMYEVIAMVQQLGIPTWFMTLSCADLRWPDLFCILSKIKGNPMTDEEIENLSYSEKCSLLNLNPVITAKHFQYRVETFFKEVLLSNVSPIGKIIYYALRIEFQMRGSPHLHSLIWTSDCPKLTPENEEEYIAYMDQHVQASLPDAEKDSDYCQLVKTFQKHNHSRSCKKYRNVSCRFNFGQFFTDKTIVSKPLPDEISDEQKAMMLNRRNEILCAVKQKINENLDPSKSNYDAKITAKDVLDSCNVSMEDYKWALSTSADNDFELHLKRPVDSCFINNYFEAGIKGFRANVDLQPVFNHYKCITYVCSYFSKDETECSQGIMNAAKEAKTENLDVRESLKKVGAAFLSCREVSAQECVYRSLPELWLRKTFPVTVFVNTGLPQERLRIAKCQQELEELDDDSTDIFKSNIIERYSDRPHTVEHLCLAEFAAHYYKEYKKNLDEENDVQPNVLSDDLVESQHIQASDSVLPKTIELTNSKEIMKCRKIKAVIRFHVPNRTKEPEKFYHHLLMLYLPWRKETELQGRNQLFATKYYESSVKTIVDRNREIFEPNAEAINIALQAFSENPTRHVQSYDVLNDQENDDLSSEVRDNVDDDGFNEDSPEVLVDIPETHQTSTGTICYSQPSAITDELLRESVRSLNRKQRFAYDLVLSWCRNVTKNVNCLSKDTIEPIHLFITGGAGSGKSHLIRAMYHTAVNMFKYCTTNPALPTVLLTAPTGVAAVNISGTTVNTALAIPKEAGSTLSPLSDQKKTFLRQSLSELRLIVVDELSMISNNKLLHIHQRLKEIFGTSVSKLFADISIICVGDFYQLPPIREKPVFCNYSNDLCNVMHPWHVFKMIELTQIMRQIGDHCFTELLNRIRIAKQSEEDISTIQSRSVDLSDTNNYPLNELHVWAENKPVTEYNNQRLEEISSPLHVLQAVDLYPTNVSKHEIEKVLLKGRSATGGLDFEINVKESARVMLTSNVDISDRLINGQLGTVARIVVNEISQKPIIIYVKFDDELAGDLLINKSADIFAMENRLVPIKPILSKIKINSSKKSSPEIQRVQFPLALAWACTVHKVQGLTVNNVVISFQLFKQNTFNYGQIYVALSRATSLQGIHVLGKLKNKYIRADPRVHDEYERLRKTSLLNEDVEPQLEENTNLISIVLLNIRSLKKHSIDIKFDKNIFSYPLILLTETQLLASESHNDIEQNLSPMILERQDSEDRFSSLALCHQRRVIVSEKQYIPALNGLKFCATFCEKNNHEIRFVLLYRKHSMNVTSFVNNLRTMLNQHSVDVILGDFNLNYFTEKDCRFLITTLEGILGFQQIVNKPTFVSSGSLLDHVYIKPEKFKAVSNSIVSVYYSDHEGVRINFEL